MLSLWEQTKHLFQNNDGSLPEIRLDVLSNQGLSEAYTLIQAHSSCLESTGAYYWSKSKCAEVPIRFGENPVLNVETGEAEPFHVVFGDIISPSGSKVPSLGVFIFKDQIFIDYRMGSDWDELAVIGFFELIDLLSQCTHTDTFEHLENMNDSGDELLNVWQDWRKGYAT